RTNIAARSWRSSASGPNGATSRRLPRRPGRNARRARSSTSWSFSSAAWRDAVTRRRAGGGHSPERADRPEEASIAMSDTSWLIVAVIAGTLLVLGWVWREGGFHYRRVHRCMTGSTDWTE